MKKLDRANQWNKSIFVTSAAFAITLIIISLTMERRVNVYDEGIILTAAMRVAAGDIIHRDFYANYGPAAFYIVSWLFELFGQNVFSERIFDLIVRAGISTIIYSSLAHYSKQWLALMATAVCVVWLSTIGNHGYPIYPALLLAICASLMMTKAVARDAASWHPFVAGALTGISALFRYDIGFFVLVANILSIALIVKLTKKESNQRIKNAPRLVLAYASGAGLPVLIILLWYFEIGALSSFYHDVVAFPSQYYAKTRGLPFPTLSSFFRGSGYISLAIYLPAIICAAAAIGFIGRQIGEPVNPRKISELKIAFFEKELFAIFLGSLAVIFYLKGIVRVSIEHMQLALLPSIILLAVLFEIARKDKVIFKFSLALLAILSISTAMLSGYVKLARNHNLVQDNFSRFVEIAISDENRVQFDNYAAPDDEKVTSLAFVDGERADAVRFIKKATTANQRIYVGLTRHDKIFVNDVSAYFMADRLPSTKWHHFDPGLQSSERIQTEIIAELENVKPNYIWLESTWNSINEPNDSAISSGIKVLDEYILNKYIPAKIFGEITILQRKL